MPRCDCGRPLKPDVVLFGELLPEAALARASALAAAADVLLCVGSSLEVYPIAQLPEITLAAGGAVALVTMGPTPYDGEAAVKLDGDVVAELERCSPRSACSRSSASASEPRARAVRARSAASSRPSACATARDAVLVERRPRAPRSPAAATPGASARQLVEPLRHPGQLAPALELAQRGAQRGLELERRLARAARGRGRAARAARAARRRARRRAPASRAAKRSCGRSAASRAIRGGARPAARAPRSSGPRRPPRPCRSRRA